MLVRPGREVDPHYLAAFFNSAYGKEMVLGKIVGAAQKHFNIGVAKEAILHFPIIQEQAAIVSALDALRVESARLQELYRRKAGGLAALKQSILQKAFSGELTANPDKALRDAAA